MPTLTSQLCRVVAFLLVFSMGILSLAPRVDAAFVPSAPVGAAERQADMETVRKALENKMVGERLAALGYEKAEIDQRLAALSDEEVHQLASRIDQVTSGGILGVVIAVLVIVILVIIILKLTDKKVVIGQADGVVGSSGCFA